MTEQMIKVEGLPEGWKAKEFRLGEVNEPYYDPATKSICKLLLGSTVGVLIVEKIQPLRIVLEETGCDYKVPSGYFYGDAIAGFSKNNHDSEITLHLPKTIWREVKEPEEPELSLSVAQCKELLEVTAHRNDAADMLEKFIKENS